VGICKNRSDSEKEVDRTITYINETINELTALENNQNGVNIEGGIVYQVKRSPLGVALVCGPFNYPLNEFCTLFIPAVIMGNSVVIKTPRIGGLVHIPLLEAYRDCFPRGVVSVIHGSGREVFTPIMQSGKINILALLARTRQRNSFTSRTRNRSLCDWRWAGRQELCCVTSKADWPWLFPSASWAPFRTTASVAQPPRYNDAPWCGPSLSRSPCSSSYVHESVADAFVAADGRKD